MLIGTDSAIPTYGYVVDVPKFTPRDAVLIALMGGAKTVNEILKLHDELAKRDLLTVPSRKEVLSALEELKAFGAISVDNGKITLNVSDFDEEFKDSINFKVRLVNILSKRVVQMSTTN